MKLLSKAMEGVKHLSVRQRGILKICIASFALMLATLIPALVSVKWRIYGIIWVITYIFTIRAIFFKKK